MLSVKRNAFSLVELLVVVAIFGVLIGLAFAAAQRVRATAHRVICASHLRQIGIGLSVFHDDHGSLPAGMVYSRGGGQFRLAGWGVPLLPYIDQTPLYDISVQAFSTAKSVLYNPPHRGLNTAVPLYECPVDPRSGKPAQVKNIEVAFTGYLGNEGTNQFLKDGVLFVDSAVRFEHVSDGTSTTILVAERPPSPDLKFGWWYAGSGLDMNGACDMVGGSREINQRAGSELYTQCPVGPYSYGPGSLTNQCDMFHFWSLHSGGAHFLLCDGSVHFLAYSADPILPALATRAGNEIVALP